MGFTYIRIPPILSFSLNTLSNRSLSLSLLCMVSGQQLNIKPTGDSHIRPIDGTIVFTCTADGLDNPQADPFLKWYDKEGKEINDRTGR